MDLRHYQERIELMNNPLQARGQWSRIPLGTDDYLHATHDSDHCCVSSQAIRGLRERFVHLGYGGLIKRALLHVPDNANNPDCGHGGVIPVTYLLVQPDRVFSIEVLLG